MVGAYPQYPVPSAAALVYHEGKVLMIQRNTEPGTGKWSLPGGKIELGENATEAAAREIMEECSVEIEVSRLLNAVDVVIHDDNKAIRYHYLILIYLARYLSGTPQISSETLEVRWVNILEALSLDLTGTARLVLRDFINNIIHDQVKL